MEKAVETLADVLTDDMQRLWRRHRPVIAWLDLLQPVIKRNAARAQGGDRFERRDAVPGRPRRTPAVPPQDQPLTEGEAPRGGEPVTRAGEPVPPAVRDRLRSVIGPEIELARVHTDRQSDAFARALRADAVTVDKDIYFRSGSFAPQSPAGLGLLAHELTHVTQSGRPGAEWARATPDGVRREEQLARSSEQSVARAAVSPVAARAYAAPAGPSPAGPGPATSPGAVAAPGAATGRADHLAPMRADADRPAADPAVPAVRATPDLERLRQTLFRDIMSRVRVEFERGA
jgi:hypothetical protein